MMCLGDEFLILNAWADTSKMSLHQIKYLGEKLKDAHSLNSRSLNGIFDINFSCDTFVQICVNTFVCHAYIKCIVIIFF